MAKTTKVVTTISFRSHVALLDFLILDYGLAVVVHLQVWQRRFDEGVSEGLPSQLWLEANCILFVPRILGLESR